MNVHGLPGRNIPCDLLLEHMNRVCKDSLRELHSNKTEQAIIRVGKCIGTLTKILDQYDKSLGIINTSGNHNVLSSAKDTNLLVEELTRSRVFATFPDFTSEQFPHEHLSLQTSQQLHIHL